MLKCKATNGKSDTVKDDVKDKTDKVMLDCNFSECIDGSEGKETILSLFLSSHANILYYTYIQDKIMTERVAPDPKVLRVNTDKSKSEFSNKT